MGNSLPLISKEIITHDVECFRSAACSMQGYRGEMEDALICATKFTKFPTKWLVGVFDGHCGAGMSKLLSRDLYGRLNASDDLSESTIRTVCVDLDKHYMESQRSGTNGALENQPGSTAVFAIVEKKDGEDSFEVLTCNIGDSRILHLTKDGQVIARTEDHKPENEEELARIRRAGGFVEMSRVDGSLALSRAFGDAVYKNNSDLPHEEQKVIPVPDFQKFTAKPGDLMVVACDGLFEACTNEHIGEFIFKRYSEGASLDQLAMDAVNEAVLAGSTDNISCQVIKFESEKLPAAKTEEYYVPGIFFTKGSKAFKDSFKQEAVHLGLSPADVREAAIVVEDSRMRNPELEPYFERQKAVKRFPLPHTPGPDALVFHPREAAANADQLEDEDVLDMEDGDEPSGGDDDLMMQLRNLIAATSGAVDPQDVFRQILMMQGQGDMDDDEDDDHEEDDEDDDMIMQGDAADKQ